MRHQLVFRHPTCVSQYTPQEAEQKKAAFAQSTMTLINMSRVSQNIFVNLDENAVYFENHQNYSINQKGAKTLSVRHGIS